MKEVLESVLGDDAPFVAMMRTGLSGLTESEYLWEPVEGCWSVRPVEMLRTQPPPWAASTGNALEIEYPDPVPAPFTTLAWRLVHLTGSVDVAAPPNRARPRPDGAIDDSWSEGRRVPSRAAEAVELLEASIVELQSLVTGASDDDLMRRERQWWDASDHTAAVWEHVMYYGYFEPVSHAAEVRMIRDLYRHTKGGTIVLRTP